MAHDIVKFLDLVIVCPMPANSALQALGLHVAVKEKPEDERRKNRGIEQCPDDNGEGLIVQHVRGESHLRDEVCKLGATHHGPADHPPRRAHEGGAHDFCENARKDAQDGALPEGREREQLCHGDGEGHRASEENADHPRRHAFRLLHPDMVRMVRRLQARKGHASDEATPEVRAQQVRDQGVDHQEDDLQEEQQLVLLQADSPPTCQASIRPAQRSLWNDDSVDHLRPELHGQYHAEEHERNANDGCQDHLEQVELPTEAEKDIEQDQGQNVVHEGGRDDGLPKLLLQHTCLT
mmetsp:Transcript_29423/g.68401  ORF Transcript_29423/g.68401 Transcript_29423/m.68401 type:complete len:294 (-) Transcript_29423:206-1087(-)